MNSAKKYFLEKECAFVLINDDVTHVSHERGIRRLLDLTNIMKGADIADKIVGYAAAAIMVEFGARAVYAEVLSVPAKECLEKAGVELSFGRLVENIKNRDKTGMCPMERATLGKQPKEAVRILRNMLDMGNNV